MVLIFYKEMLHPPEKFLFKIFPCLQYIKSPVNEEVYTSIVPFQSEATGSNLLYWNI